MQVRLRILPLLCALIAVCSCENRAQSENEPIQKSSVTSETTAINAARSAGDPPFEIVEGRKSEFVGDFDSDGEKDHVVLVKSSSLSPRVVANSNVNFAWPYYGEGDPPTPSNAGPIALLVTSAYKTNKKISFLIVDPNPISILATEASTEMFVATRNGSDDTVWSEVGDAAAGDVLVIPTEAGIDSYLYWNGEKYTSLEVPEIP